jgi:hypothetical protein
MQDRETAMAVWMGTAYPTVRRAMVSPAPPVPAQPRRHPRTNIPANIIRTPESVIIFIVEISKTIDCLDCSYNSIRIKKLWRGVQSFAFW